MISSTSKINQKARRKTQTRLLAVSSDVFNCAENSQGAIINTIFKIAGYTYDHYWDCTWQLIPTSPKNGCPWHVRLH
jgi:hypothetical protein